MAIKEIFRSCNSQTALYHLKRARPLGFMDITNPGNGFRLDPEKLPKPISIDLTPSIAKHLERVSTATGRSIDELILEILDKGLQDS